MTQTPELLPVEQSDREAAWPFVSSNSIAGQDKPGWMRGDYDDAAAIQAFARHRRSHAIHEPASVMREALVRTLDVVDEVYRKYGFEGFDADDIKVFQESRAALAAIRNLPLSDEVGG